MPDTLTTLRLLAVVEAAREFVDWLPTTLCVICAGDIPAHVDDCQYVALRAALDDLEATR